MLVFDGRGGLRRAALPHELGEEVVGALARELRERARQGDGQSFAPAPRPRRPRARAAGRGADAAPRRGALPQAWLVAAKDNGRLAEIDRLILHQAVTVVALELLRRRVADSTERRLAGDVLTAIVAGDLDGVELVRRLEPFGLGDRVGAIVLAPPGRAAPAACETALADALRAEAVNGLVARADGARARARARRAPTTSCSRSPSAWWSASRPRWGAGRRPAPGARCPRAARARPSTRRAARSRRASWRRAATQRRNGNGGASHRTVATYRDLGSFQLLLSLQDTDALRLFCDTLLSPIESGEGHYGGELMRSLEAFIECNGQWERPPSACTATATPCATGSAGSRSSPGATSPPRATASSSGSPCAGARSSIPCTTSRPR